MKTCPKCESIGKKKMPCVCEKMAKARQDLSQTASRLRKEMEKSAEPLGSDFAKVLGDNSWDLYEE